MSEPLIVGNYELRNCVASGNTTQIWEVSQQGSPMQLAMKLMLDEHRKDSSERAVLKHEFKIGRVLEHPNFLRFHEIEINRDHSFFVMDYFRSPSLKTHITSNLPAIQSSFPKLAESLAAAFGFMHETGWLHRDIKPDNVLVNKAGEARIIDFSLSAKVQGSLGKLLAGKSKHIQGTRTYIAPETILKKKATEQTDMYSLGVTFFEVLTGQPVFAGDSPNALLKKHLGEDAVAPSAFNPNVTKDLDRIILRTLEKNPRKRFDSIQDLANALRSCRCFERDPVELHEEKLAEAKALASESVDKRLDSRADADRTSRGIKAPLRAKREVKIDPKLLREEAERKAKEAGGAPQQPAAAAPQQPMMQPGMMPQQPMMPGMMPPGMMPQQPMMQPGMMPQQPMMQPGMPMPQQPMMQPGMPMPQQPAMQPGMPMPQQPMMQPGMPVPQQPGAQPAMPPVPQQPVQAQPVAPAGPAASPANPSAPAPAAAEEPEVASTEDMMDLMSQLDIE